MSTTGMTNLIDDQAMRKLGFYERIHDQWFRCVTVTEAVAFTITIDKHTGNYHGEVLCLESRRPYPYAELTRVPAAQQTRHNIDREVAKLRSAGLNIWIDHEAHAVLV